MSDRIDAARYARELFEVTWRHGQAETVDQELWTIAEATRDYKAQVQPLFHPLVPKARKLQTIAQFSDGLGLSRPTRVLLEALAQNYRLRLLGPLAISFRERLNAKRGVVRAKVMTAAPLGPAQIAALSARLATLTGRQVQLSAKVDPSIIGGVVTQVGSTVYDGSVTSQLARMRRKLVENV